MIDQEIIERTIRLNGGRLDFSELGEELKVSYALVKHRAEKSIEIIANQLNGIEKISFDIIDNYSFNAFATGINHHYFIGINRGTIATLSLIFDRLLADKEVLKLFGDVTKEKDDLPLFDNVKISYEATTKMLPQFSPPQCPVRFAFSKHMTRMAFDFILAHEIGHIISGHISLSQIKHNMLMDEISMVDDAEVVKKMMKKTLEMDADIWATTILLSSEINRITGRSPLPGKEWTDFYNRPGMVLMQFAFVVSTIFKLFGDNRLDNNTFKLESYPKPRLRCFISMLAIKSNLDFIELNKKTNYDLDKFGIPISISAAFNLIESAFENITGKKSSSQSIDDAWGELGMNQINLLVEYWNTNLLNELKEISYLKIFEKETINTTSNNRFP